MLGYESGYVANEEWINRLTYNLAKGTYTNFIESDWVDVQLVNHMLHHFFRIHPHSVQYHSDYIRSKFCEECDNFDHKLTFLKLIYKDEFLRYMDVIRL